MEISVTIYHTNTIRYKVDGQLYKTQETMDSKIIIDAPKKDGYTFVHWKGGDKKNYNPGDVYTEERDLTLEAEYKENDSIWNLKI